ncbi:hypothetical protein [Glutamicibacter sp. FBE19]|uniref:hypothetical protein n=1 Tax=Glutamicibacter sp. FBE19 TaxID=2761534 RepID=UPI00189659C5|nr:hypothetical protein [Glutamicibacter sp. FBE19]MBF6671569.1 hypothetical protein [Glutamicibacter sp. FBE19]
MSGFQQRIDRIVEDALDRAMERIEDLNATTNGGTIRETSDALAYYEDFQNAWEDYTND